MRSFRSISFLGLLALAMGLDGASQAQSVSVPHSTFAAAPAAPEFPIANSVTRLSPDLALARYERGLEEQSTELTGYTATSVIDAELPDSAQRAEFEIKRHYSAPSVLEFSPLRFTGDKFVKTNVIV